LYTASVAWSNQKQGWDWAAGWGFFQTKNLTRQAIFALMQTLEKVDFTFQYLAAINLPASDSSCTSGSKLVIYTVYFYILKIFLK
jgi:hypothetical protein